MWGGCSRPPSPYAYVAKFLTTIERLLEQMQGYPKDFKLSIDVRCFFGACKVQTPFQVLKLH